MNTSEVKITDVLIQNSVSSKVAKVDSIASCIGIDDNYKSREWKPMCDTMTDICHGIVDNVSIFAACSTPADTEDSKIYTFTDTGTEDTIVHISGYTFSKVFIYCNILIAITTDGKILKIDNLSYRYNNDNLKFMDFPEPVVDAAMISNTLWILSPTKLYQINGAFDEIIPTAKYPDGIEMEAIVPAVGSNDIVLYANTTQLPMFIRYQIDEKKFSAFTSAVPFTIVNAILLGNNSPILYVYGSDTKVRTLSLKDVIGFFDFASYEGKQWVGKCTYYDGFIYNQYLDLTSGTPKLFLARSMNGISFQLVSEDFDYVDEMYGKYCQGSGQSVFITPTMYKINTPYIYGIDYSRYSDMIEVKNAPCIEKTDNIMKFDISESDMAGVKMVDMDLTFVNLKFNGKSTVNSNIVSMNSADITVSTKNPDIINTEELTDITADFITKRIW